MMNPRSSEQSLDQINSIRKDPITMNSLTPTNCQANDLSIREVLRKAERYHALTRTDEVKAKQPTASIRLASRFVSIPVRRTLTPQH